MADLQNNLQRLYTAQMQQSTGKKIQRLSDDPVGIIAGLNARTQLSRIEQFQRNITDAKRWLESAELSMRDMSAVAQDAYELCVEAGSDTIPDDVRASAIAPKVKVLIEQLVSYANATTSDEYTFGGFNTRNNLPIEWEDGIVNGWCYNTIPLSSFHTPGAVQTEADNNTLQFQVGFGQNVDVTMTAPEILVFQSSEEGGGLKDLLTQMQKFYEDLESGCSAQTAASYIQDFQDAQTHIDAAVSEMGGRWNRIEMMEDRYSKDELMYSTVKSTLEDVDIAEAIMNFAMTQSVYTASLQVGAQVIQPTLMDYLR